MRFKDAAAVHGRRVNTMMSAGTRQLAIHRLTWFTLGTAVLVVWQVPQIGALIPFPPRSETELALTSFAALVSLSYFVLWLCIFPMHAVPQRLLDEHVRDTWLARRTAQLDALVGKRMDSLLDKLPQSGKWPLLLGALLVLLVRLSWATPLAIHLGVLGLWLVLRPWLDRLLASDVFGAPEDTWEAARRVFDRAITIVLVTNAGGELLWNVQTLMPHDLPYRVYSTWATLQTIFWIILAVAACDALSVLGLPWIRTKAVLALALLTLLVSGGERVGSIDHAAALLVHGHASAQDVDPAASRKWADQLLARLREIPETQPVLLVAASGGGSRAALLASLVYEKLRLTPAKVENGEAARTLADDVLLISSVSGGSLATAYFLTQGASAAPAHAGQARGTYVDPDSSPFVRSMATDFMAPLLRGVLNLKQERGASVSSFWTEQFAWKGITDAAERGKNRPLVVFNATAVQTGTRVGVGFPALPAGLLKPAIVPADIDASLRITLSDAVRLSANFPYGFEYAVLTDEKSKDAKDPVDDQIIDGGVVDNTGLDTLAVLMDALQRQASVTPTNKKSQAEESSFRLVLDEMRKRGVLLIEIDAGARPSPPTWPATSFSSLSKPVEALGQAGHRNASILREHNISHIREALDDEEDVPAVVGVVRAGFDCTQEGDVITAWALGHAARAQIYDDFRHVEGRLATSLAVQLEAIAKLHAARRFAALIDDETRLPDDVKAQTTKQLIASASETRLLYETYLEQSMAVDAIEHANARDCAALKNETMSKPTEHTLHEGLDKATQTVAEVQAKIDVAWAQLFPNQPMAGAPNANAPSRILAGTGAGDTRAVPRSVLGWIYLGNRIGNAWQTKNTSWNGADKPPRGTIVEVVAASYVRASAPDKRGRLAPIRIALKPHTSLQIVEVRDWADTGLVWAQVATPAVRAKNPKQTTPGAAAD